MKNSGTLTLGLLAIGAATWLFFPGIRYAGEKDVSSLQSMATSASTDEVATSTDDGPQKREDPSSVPPSKSPGLTDATTEFLLENERSLRQTASEYFMDDEPIADSGRRDGEVTPVIGVMDPSDESLQAVQMMDETAEI